MKTKRFIAFFCVCAAVVGCSQGSASLPPLYPTTIAVVYDDGTPVEGATVALRPTTVGSAIWNLTGVTDAQGKLVLQTNGKWNGAPVGFYEAMVTKEVAEIDETGASAVVKSRAKYIDDRFGNPKTSGLTVEVKEGDNQIELKVGEKIEEAVPATTL